jgi:broad specificity phosphatase PhoE
MKWPANLTLIRHGESGYNILKKKKDVDPLYQKFKKAYEQCFDHPETRRLAQEVQDKYALKVSDYATPLTRAGWKQSRITGGILAANMELPDVVLVSPYLRTRNTHKGLVKGWPALGKVPVIFEDRIREQEHGLQLIYNDWRTFHVFHPDQKALYELMGEYWYQYPQGESTSQVRERIRSFQTTLVREYAGQRVLLVTHHLTILSVRANLERLKPEQFLHINEHQKPVNCGVTTYECNPAVGKAGRLELKRYNEKYY